ncbi:MAG: hypothetical protein OER95_16005 [Acidimicrobiia bacterium]|nr:hypothetical protein [Acidimicrobiia bacterium]
MARAAAGAVVWRPRKAESKSQRPLVFAWLTITGGLALVALLISIDATTGLALNQAGADPSDSTGPLTLDISGDDDDAVRTSVVYGSMEWTLIETRLVPRDKDSFSRPVVILDMVARNLDREHQARARSRDLNLILEDGSRAPVHRFEHTPSTYRIAVEPGQAVPVTLVFKPALIHDPWLNDLVLEIAEEYRHPALLPLDGSGSPNQFPLTTSVAPANGAGRVEVPTDSTVIGLTVTDATVDLNAGPYRAMADEQLVIIRVEVEGLQPAPAGQRRSGTPIWSTRDFWQLAVTVEGAVELFGPDYITFPHLGSGGIGSAPGLELVFAIPADAEPATMVLGAGAERVKIGSIRSSRVVN